MIRSILFAAALIAPLTPLAAQTHEPVTGAVSGRSPHVMMRQLAQPARPCGKPHHLPAGKLAVFGGGTACERDALAIASSDAAKATQAD